MFDSGSITPLPLDPEGLRAFVEGLPPEAVEQFIKNWRGQNEARERSQTENLLLHELLRRQQIEKYGLCSEQLSDEELERLREEPGEGEAPSERRGVDPKL
jgi:hypothetical protein